MKKRTIIILAIAALLVVALVTVGIVLGVQKASTYEQIIKEANAIDFTKSQVHDCPACGAKRVTWQVLTADSDDDVAGLYGHYYLTEGFAQKSNMTAGEGTDGKQTLCIHFNGQTITGGNGRGAVTLNGGATLNLMGASGGFTTDFEVNIFRNNDGTGTVLNIYGGNYTSTDGTVIAMNKDGLTANIYAGTINGNVNANGTCVVNVAGGSISKLVVTKNATVNLSGTPTITALSMPAGKTVGVQNLTEGANIVVFGTSGEVITEAGMAAYAKYFTGAFPSEVVANTEGKLVYQTPDWSKLTPDEMVEIASKMDFSGAIPTYCPVCKLTFGVTWTALTEKNSAMEGHYYLADSITAPENYTTAAESVVCVNLNGKTLNGGHNTNGIFSQRPSTLNLMGKGNVTANDEGSRIFNVQQGCTLNIYGGTYTTSKTAASGVASAAIYSTGVNDDCVVNMYGGTVKGAAESAAVYVRQGTIFKMYGGTIETGPIFIANTAHSKSEATQTAGAEIYGGVVKGGITVRGTDISEEGAALAVSGGTINKIDASVGSEVTLSGKPTITLLNLPENNKITVDKLETGAKIAVWANGVFTKDFADAAAAEAAKAFFTAYDAEKMKLEVSDKALTCVTVDGSEPVPPTEPVTPTEPGQITDPTTPTTPNPTTPTTPKPTTPTTPKPTTPTTPKPTTPTTPTTKPTEPKPTTPAPSGSIYQQAKAMDFSKGQVLDCPACGAKKVTWTALNSAVGGQQIQGHYYLADKNVDIGGTHITVGTGNGQKLCVHLNGNTLTGGNENGIFSMRECVLNVMGDGTVTGGASASRVFNTNAGTINIYGGNYGLSKGGRTVWTNGPGAVFLHNGTIDGTNGAFAVYLTKGGNFIMKDGVVKGGRLYTDDMDDATASVTINGGTVEHLGVTQCNLIITGGTLDKIDVTDSCQVALSGKPVIGLMNLPDDFKINATGLTSGADITIKAYGVFTTNFKSADAAEAAKKYFKPIDEMILSRKDLALFGEKKEPAA